jgi:hypothetical protein
MRGAHKLLLPDKNDARNKLKVKHLTYNTLFELFGSKSLGWPNGKHSWQRRKRKGEYVVDIGHRFVDALSSLLSLLSDHEDSFETYRIKMKKWCVNCMVIKTSNTKFSLGSPRVQEAVCNTRALIVGDWVQIPQWSCCIEDVRALLSCCYKLVDKRKGGKEKQREKRMRKEPCKYFKDAVMWKCEFIGVSGQANDRRHHQLYKILKQHDFFVPYLASDPLTFHDHGDPSAMTIDKRANVRRSFLSSGPSLQVEARSGGPYVKISFGRSLLTCCMMNCISRTLWSKWK